MWGVREEGNHRQQRRPQVKVIKFSSRHRIAVSRKKARHLKAKVKRSQVMLALVLT